MAVMHVVVKVQIPLVSSEETPKALVYTEGRKFNDFIPIDRDLLRKMNGELKRYFYADVSTTGEVTLHGRAPWQDW